jgi:hypothetical protein
VSSILSKYSAFNLDFYLPVSELIDISLLSQIFDNTTNSYKYLFFIAILNLFKSNHFDYLSTIKFEEIALEMLAISWYPYNKFGLSFGVQDLIPSKIRLLNIKISETSVKHKQADKERLKQIIKNTNIDETITWITRYVPFRLIRPFFTKETEKVADGKVNQYIVYLTKQKWEENKPLYCFDSDSLKDCQAIIFHPDWQQYIAQNYLIIKNWAFWHWLKYMQNCNQNITVIGEQIIPPKNFIYIL